MYLTAIGVSNSDSVERTLEVLVERDGEQVYRQTHRLGPHGEDADSRDTVELDPTWDPSVGGSFVVRSRLDDAEDWQTFDLTEQLPAEEGDSPFCTMLLLDVNGDVTTWFNPDGSSECPDGVGPGTAD
ncbi:MAG TPA: hypothetical protein VKM69_13385 [Natronoarchaeum rubrum]|nr:hypothetical protein [Natronoarchaeum rubrum]